jgi:hypothetical protein
MKQAVTPLLFGFASLSLVLSSMQVLLAVPDENLHLDRLNVSSIVAMERAFWAFSIMMLVLSGVVWCLLFVIPLGALIRQIAWGYKNRGKSSVEGPVQSRKEVTSTV